ncbi:hypothetical protein ACROYT_G028403 [Oculina patagonica]
MPTKKSLSEAVSNFLLLLAAANHNLKICCRDLFKTDLDDNYNALYNNKHPIGSGLFGDELTKWLNTVTESNKAAKQLTRSTKASFQKYKGPPKSFLGQGVRHQRPFNQYSHEARGYQRSNRPSYRKKPSKTETKTKQTDCETVIIQPEVVSRDTISRWIKIAMITSGIDVGVFKPHSTRAASTSKANACQVPIDVILKAASWKGDCTFRKFYNKPIVDNVSCFGQAFLGTSTAV